MILLYDIAKSGPYATIYRDSNDANLFYFSPEFAEVRILPSHRLAFGARMFHKNPNIPDDGFSLYNFGVKAVVPSSILTNTLDELKQQYGPNVSLVAIPSQNPTLSPLTQGIYTNINCQANGGNIHTDLACSFRVPEDLEPDMSKFFKSALGWAGAIDYKVRTKKTSFEWKITANWHRVQTHFKAQTSVSHWFVKTNLSYETRTLIENDTIKVEISGGTPSDKEKIYTMAEKVAARLFVQSLEETPLPAHPSGAVVCLSINYSKIEEDKTSISMGSESDFEDREMSIAVYVQNIPADYFSGFDKKIAAAAEAFAPSYPPGFELGFV
ncbi:MAG: hypothetical protein ABIT76_12045 [Chthoniobacterales bacterium]